MAIGAAPVSARRLSMLLSMAGRARLLDAPGVRLVAAETLLVSGADCSLLGAVTRFAGGTQLRRVVREPAVASLARRMAGEHRAVRHLLGVARGARLSVRAVEREVVWLVAAHAGHLGVKPVVRERARVAAPASSCNRGSRSGARMRVVATDAGARGALHRVVRMHARMATRASSLGSPLHVVRRMTIGTRSVRRHARPTEHVHGFVAAPAGDRLGGSERMGTMAGHALRVTIRE
jgi:hypothetical protein